MGAWGSGSFENDAALDWAASVQSIDDVREPFDRLNAVGSGYVDADLASDVIAAAETVAMLMGRRSADFPEDLRQQLAGAGEPDSRLYHQARSAVMQVMDELRHALGNSCIGEGPEQLGGHAGSLMVVHRAR